jgi:hypothetical protein
MSKKRFDINTRTLFEKVQTQISEIDGKLLSPKLAPTLRNELVAAKAALRKKVKEIKVEYYADSVNRVLNETKSLQTRLETLKVEDITKNSY